MKPPQKKISESIYRKYDFRWEVLDGIIGGKSMLDIDQGLIGFPMKTRDDASRFITSYGYDLDDPIENAEAMGNFHEAINFARKHFLYPENPDGIKTDVPRKILEITDIRDLLLIASMSYPGQMSDSVGNHIRDWACALLKIIHAIAHLDKDIRYPYFSEIQKQIFDRFYKVVQRDPKGNLFLGQGLDDPYRVALESFDTKPKKSRESILIKLLHKPENVADEIFDRVGLRFITGSRLDALLVVKYLKDNMIVMPANIKPSRSRNNLIDVDSLKAGLKDLIAEAVSAEYSEAQLRDALLVMTKSPVVTSANPHSSPFFRSIQFTCRQLIKLTNPLYEQIKEMKTLVKEETLSENFKRAVAGVDLSYLQREIRFFYPFEVQVIDRAANEENEKGRSAHSEYKKSQVQTAMIRVMGNLTRGSP